MIKINLLSNRSSGAMGAAVSGVTGLMSTGGSDGSLDASMSEDIKKDAFKKLVLILVGPIALFIYESNNIPSLSRRLSNLQQELDNARVYNEQAAPNVAEIKKFKESELQIESRITALERISQHRFREVKLMELFHTITPSRLWFTRLEISGDKLEIKGLAMSDADVTALSESLKNSALILEVKSLETAEVEQESVLLKRFEISCSLEKLDG